MKPLKVPGMDLKLRPSNDLILRETMVTVPDATDKETMAVAINMLAIMQEKNGIGLACPQVGIRWRMVVTAFGVFIDPKVVWESPQTCEMEEGCLSFPGEFHVVTRPEKVKVETINIGKGTKLTLNLEGLAARVIQHEIDHLNGKLFRDGA